MIIFIDINIKIYVMKNVQKELKTLLLIYIYVKIYFVIITIIIKRHVLMISLKDIF